MNDKVKVTIDCDSCIHRYTCKYESTAKEFKKFIETTCKTDKEDVNFRIIIDCEYWRS